MSECLGCTQGVTMCHRSPCHGAVEDIERLINEGHIGNISLQVGICIDDSRCISALLPSYEGMSGYIHYNTLPQGTCSLLKDEKCSVHTIKPLLGKVSCCKDTGHSGVLYTNTRNIIKASWKKEGHLIIKRWGEYWNCRELVDAILDFRTDESMSSEYRTSLKGDIDRYNLLLGEKQ